MRWLARGARRRTTATLAVVTVPAVVAVLAFTGRGFPLARVDLNDGGVWLTATSKLQLGRFNFQVQELNGGLVTTGGDFDVEQDGGDVLLVERSTVSVVDPASVTTTTQVAAPGAKTSMAGGTVAIVDTKGNLYVRTVAGLAGLQVGADPADVALGDGGQAVVAVDGTALGFAADGTVTRVTTTGAAPGAQRAGSLRTASAPDQVTAVGDEPVALTDHTLHTLHGDVELEGDDLTLQQPGPASSRVLVASRTALLEVPLDGSHVVTHPSGGSGGTPAAPVQVGGCAHAAWSAASGSYVQLCNGHETRRNLKELTSSDHLRFRVNRDVVVLNDTAAGRVWLPTEDAEVRVPNWDMIRQEQPEQSDEQKDSNDTTQNLVTDCSTVSSPPTAKGDSFGVRAGRTTVLPVVDNDSTSDCAILVISQFDTIPAEFGTVQAIYGGRALQVAVAPGASGSVDFTYTITDGHGTSVPSTAHVHLSVTDATLDRAPTQTRVGLLRVEQGGQTQQDVLADFSDPDGDDLLLVGATADPAAGTVRFKQDGSLTFVASAGARLGRTTVALQVSDGQETTNGTLDVEVRPSGSVPPRIDPVHAVTYVDQPVLVKPLDSVRSGSAEPARLAAVTDVQGATITPDLAAGTFTFSSARAGSYYVQFTVVAPPQQGTGLARIDVLPRPDQAQPPVAVRDAAFLPAGGQTTIDPLANDSDPAGNVLVLQDVEVPASAGLKVALIEHHLVQVRAQRTLEGPVSLTYTVSNGTQTAKGEIVVHPVPPSATSQPPVVPNVEADVRTGGVVTIPVLDTAYDPDGDDITLQGALPAPPAAGQGLMFVSGDVLRYQAPDTPMTVRATFAVQDPSGNVTAAQVTVHVHASDASSKAPPRPRDLEARAFAGDTVRIQVPLVGIDPDGDGVTLLGQASAPTQGRIVDTGPDWLEFQAYDDAVGTDSFTYAVEDWTGQRAVATVRVGIAPRPLGASSVVTRDDTVTVKPNQTVEVRVLANDVDSSGADLTLDEKLEMAAGIDATVDGGRIVVHAPSKPGTLQIAYTARDERGGHDTGVLTVTVSDEAPVLAPIARDVVVPATQTIDRTEVAVDVLAVAQNPSGPLSDLAVRVPPQFADVARVDPLTNKVVVTLVDHTLTVPFMLVNTTAADAQSYAFITVPALGFFAPMPRPKAPELRVASGQQLVIPLDEQIQVAPGRVPSIADPTAVTATRSDGGSLVKSSTAVQFTSAKGYAGPASITVPVTDARSAGETSAHTAVITLPITVFAVDEHPPTFDAAVLDVAPGEDPLTVDLRAFTRGPEGASGTAAEYTYSMADAVPAGFSAALHGSVLTVSAAVTTPKGRTDQLAVRIGYGQSGHLDVQVPLRVIASTRPTARVLDQTVSDGEEGVAATVRVLDGAFNPFPSDPLTVVGATVETPDSGSASVTGSTVTVRPAVGFIGQMVTRFTVRDVTNDPDRAVEGRITVVVRGKPAVPGMPQVVSIGNKSVVLSWQPPDNRGAPITGYRVVASPGGAATECPATTCTIDGLTNDTEYTFTVAARNEIGMSDPSAPSTSARPDTVPDAPEAPVLSFGDREVTATWNAPHSDGSPVTGYTLQITPAPAKGPATVDTTSTSYTFEGLTNGTAYQVQVRARNRAPQPGAWSPWSQPMVPATVPDAPQVTATPTDSQAGRLLQIQWSAPASNGDAIVQYEVTIDGGGAPVVVTVPAGQTSYVFTDARTRTPYTVGVRGQNKAGWGPVGQVSASTFGVPDAPTSVTAQPLPGQGSVQVSWSGADGNGTDITGYVVAVSPGGRSVQVGPQTSVKVDGLTGGVTYTFTVQTQNRSGLSPASPAASAQASTPPGAPGNPTIVTTKAASGSGQPQQVTLSWGAAAENGGGSATYWWTLTGDGGRRQTGSTSSLSAVVDVNGWISPTGTTLRLTVYAQTSAAQGASASTSVTLDWGSVPGAPTSLAVASPDAGTLQATWAAPQDDGGIPIDRYTVCWALTTTPGNQLCSDVDGATYSLNRALSDLGATEGSSVKVTVLAHSSKGNGPTASLTYTVPAAGP